MIDDAADPPFDKYALRTVARTKDVVGGTGKRMVWGWEIDCRSFVGWFQHGMGLRCVFRGELMACCVGTERKYGRVLRFGGLFTCILLLLLLLLLLFEEEMHRALHRYEDCRSS